MDTRRQARVYYFIDYKTFVDVVKWKLWSMNKEIEQKMQNMRSNQGYLCTLCLKTYSPYDVINLIDSTSGEIRCEIDGMVLQQNEGDEDGGLFLRFMEQMAPILNLMKKTDDLIIPEYSPEALDKAIIVAEKSVFLREQQYSQYSQALESVAMGTHGGHLSFSTEGGATMGDLIIVREDEEGDGNGGSGGVDGGGENGAQASCLDAESRKKHVKLVNTLPIWHQVSTVTGERIVDLPPDGFMKNENELEDGEEGGGVEGAIVKIEDGSLEIKSGNVDRDAVEAVRSYYAQFTGVKRKREEEEGQDEVVASNVGIVKKEEEEEEEEEEDDDDDEEFVEV